MKEDRPLFDAGFDDGGPFRDTPEAGGISLESALRDFGPAAIDDLIPRVRVLAAQLDAVHRTGAVHGALHPNCIFVTDEATSLTKGTRSSAPYVAPEILDGEAASPASDQFSLAAITYEWLFGRRIDGPARRSVNVKAMPGIDRAALSKALTRALALDPQTRFPTCGEFCDAVADSTTPDLPLAKGETVDDADDRFDDEDPVGPFVPESPRASRADIVSPLAPVAPSADAIRIVAEETQLAAPFPLERDTAPIAAPVVAAPRPPIDPIDPPLTSPVDSWNPTPPAYTSTSARFGGLALIMATLVGAIFGFAAGYMARPRALQTGPPETLATPPAVETPAASASKPESAPAPSSAAEAKADSAQPPQSAAAAPQSAAGGATPTPRQAKPAAAAAAPTTGRLLVRSTPSGAAVSVDGVEKGVTPLTLGDLEYGTRNITVARSGYVTETRRVQLSRDRPSRSLDVRLAAQAAAAPPARPASQAAPAQPGVTTGGLTVESRPTGASVTVNGKPIGTTPLTMNDLPPGDYRVVMSMPGYQNVSTTVRVVAGERVRAAASLTAQEQE